MILMGTSAADAQVLAERLRLAIAAIDFSDKQTGLMVTASIGVAQLNSSDDVNRVIKRADMALYQAKERGRNQVSVL